MEPKAKDLHYTKNWKINSNGCDMIELFLWKDALNDLFRDLNEMHDVSPEKAPSGIIHLTLAEKIQETPVEDEFAFKACLFGGIGNINYANQIKCAKELGINILISDVTHQEIKSFISPSDYDFISAKLILYNVHRKSLISERSQSENKIKFITSSKFSSSTIKSIHNAISAVENVEHVNLDEIDVQDWLIRSLPDNNTQTLIVDHPFCSLNAILVQSCTESSTHFKYLSKNGLLSPSRIEYQYCRDAYEWIDEVITKSRKSTRKKITEIINPNNKRPDNDSSEYIFKQSLLKVLSHIDSSNNANNKLMESNSSSESLIFHKTPLRFLYNHTDNDFGLSETNIILDTNEEIREKLPRHFINKIFETNLKTLLNVKGYHAWFLTRRLLSGYIDDYISALQEVQNGINPGETISQIGTLIQYGFQWHNIDNNELIKIFSYLSNLSIPIRSKASILLGLGNLDGFKEICVRNIQTTREKGLAGESILFFLNQNSFKHDINQQILEQFRAILNDEIEKRNESLHTFKSLALIEIMEHQESANLDFLLDPKLEANNYVNIGTIFNQIALFHIFYGSSTTPKKLIDKQLSSKSSLSIERQFGWIAILIILNLETEASKQAIRTVKMIDEEGEFWHYSCDPFFISFYFGIIFKNSKMNSQVNQMEELMKIFHCGWNDICSNLLENLVPTKKTNNEIEELASILSKKIPHESVYRKNIR